MAWTDRDYSHEDNYRIGRRPPVFGAMRMWSVTTWLIALNVAVFVIDGILAQSGLGYRVGLSMWGPLEVWGYFSADQAIFHLQLWRFITFQFLHASIGHLFMNMLALYFFGPMVESYLRSRRYLIFYLLCGMAGGVAYLLMWQVHLLITASWVPLVGASAGIFGVLIAAARVAPDTTVMLLFPPIPMRLKVMVWIFIGLAAYTVLTQGHNAGGEAAHLGGAAAGFLLMQYPRALNWIDPLSWRKKRPSPWNTPWR